MSILVVKKLKYILSGAFITLVVIVFGLLALEVFSRFIFPISPGSYFVGKNGENIEVYGTEERFRPGIVFRQISPDFDAEVHIGNHGFRKLTDEKFPEIIFLGDSFTFGQGLNDEETFAYLFCSHFQLSCANLAVPGTGTYRQMEILQRELDRNKWKPKEIKLFLFVMSSSFMSGNDFADTLVELDLEKQTLVPNNLSAINNAPPSDSNLIDWMVRKRKLFLDKSNLLRIGYSHLGANIRTWFSPKTSNQQLKSGISAVASQIERIHELSNKRDIKLSIYLLHPAQDLLRGTYSETEEAIQNAIDDELLITRTSQILSDKPSSYYYPYDGHLNAKGAQRISALLINERDLRGSLN